MSSVATALAAKCLRCPQKDRAPNQRTPRGLPLPLRKDPRGTSPPRRSRRHGPRSAPGIRSPEPGGEDGEPRDAPASPDARGAECTVEAAPSGSNLEAVTVFGAGNPRDIARIRGAGQGAARPRTAPSSAPRPPPRRSAPPAVPRRADYSVEFRPQAAPRSPGSARRNGVAKRQGGTTRQGGGHAGAAGHHGHPNSATARRRGTAWTNGVQERCARTVRWNDAAKP